MTFKVYGPSQASQDTTSKPAPKKRGKKAAGANDSVAAGKQVIIKKEDDEEDKEGVDAVVVSPTTTSQSVPTRYQFQDPFRLVTMNNPLDTKDARYYSHFIDQVASLLLIYDNNINVNPYRRYFPEMARDSPSMASAMQALGALHLANTSQGQQRIEHFQQAMGQYGEVVKSFRRRYTEPNTQLGLNDFATCLLLSLFEMMDSQHDNWTIHLKGAREIYKILFFQNSADPNQEAQRLTEMNHPLRHFLISLLSYLDVAGACATSDGTVVEGSYWLQYAGGWEYNLGIPSLSSNTPPNEQNLVELRNCWSVMMEIQAAISSFGRAKHENQLAPAQQDVIYGDLLNRLLNWRATAPECLQVLGGLDDTSLEHYPYVEILEYAGCIEAYEKATVIYLHKVAAANRPDRQTEGPLLQMLASRILQLIGKCANGVGRLAALWPLFTAGRETHDVTEQAYVQQTMQELQRYGFKNVEKGLEELERVWFKRRMFPEGWIETMDDIRTSVLIP
jgi:tetratricopeptide (TPR) repeat protein